MNELDLFPKQEKIMTVKELSEVLGVSRQLISEKAKEMFPQIVKNGIETKLDEKQVTAIKLTIEKNPMIPSMTVEGFPKTDLEKELLIQQAMIFQREKIEKLQQQLSDKTNQVNRLIHDNKTYTTTEIAKEMNLKSAIELNKILEENGIQYKMNGTWVLTAKYSNLDYESIKQQELDNGTIIYNRHWTGKGRDFILSLDKYGEVK
jgi:phage antirepressor YoqD-like protein